MSNYTEHSAGNNSLTSSSQEELAPQAAQVKKKEFIEPTVSVPVDVLEATTNFLFVTALSSVVT